MPLNIGGLQNLAEKAVQNVSQGAQQAIDELNSTLAVLQEVGYQIANLKIEMATALKVTVQLKFSKPVTDEQLDAITKKHSGIGIAAVIAALQRVNQLRDSVKVGNLDMGEIEVVMGVPPHVVANWKAPAASATAA